MDAEAVIEFLGCVPLLQRLPASSLKKIAQVVIPKHYEEGECVVLEGQMGDGIYVIWEGEAEVTVPVNSDDKDQLDYVLKRYDYFGHGMSTSGHRADIIATSKLTCLVLPHEHCHLLQPKSFWSADRTHETIPLVENILHLVPIETNIFKGVTLPDAPKFGKVFGGQLLGQALAAASKTVDCLKFVHSLHAYFLLAGDVDIPIVYEVHRIRDGKSFATRQIKAIQKGNVIFTLLTSFQKEEGGFDHQQAAIPDVPSPDVLLSMEELRERRLTDPLLPRNYRNKVATKPFIPWPIEIRFCEPSYSTNKTKSPPRLLYWFRSRGKLSDDQALHRCVVAYASDLIFLQVSLNPHRGKDLKTDNYSSVSLDHSVWFHRPLRADDWLLFVITSPSANAARGFVSGQMFNRKGELVVSVTQEGLLRSIKAPMVATASKL